MSTQEQRRERAWWRARSINREIFPALLFGMFVYFASDDWFWGMVAAWGFIVILTRIEDVIDHIHE